MDVTLNSDEERVFKMGMKIDKEMTYAILTKKIMELLQQKYSQAELEASR